LHRLRAQRDTLVRMLRSVRAGHNPEFNDPAVATAIGEYAKYTDASPHMDEAAHAHADEDDAARSEREAELDRDSAAQADQALDACCRAVAAAEAERATAESDVALLLRVLRDLRDGYNKNYHDLAVKAAVEALGDAEKVHGQDARAAAEARASVDFAALALRVAEAQAQLDQLAPATADAADGDGGLADARAAFWDAQTQHNTAKGKVAATAALLETADLGPRDMYLAVKGDCVELDAGEFKYQVCLLDRASQTGNLDVQRVSLGTFEGFGADHTVHRYTHGTRCWNGPERSLTASFVCGTDIKILAVSEPEKCEYHAKMTGPFACALPGEESAAAADDAADDADSAADAADNHRAHDEL
ncbi:hypothetical protein IWQ57_006206, partial [Coemansia nantahalensis]